MTGKTFDFNEVTSRDSFAVAIANMWDKFNQARQPWLASRKEVRDYIFATSTDTTTNKKLPWKNSTTLPKLCQIRDNLHANYMAALFPNEDWLRWEGDTATDEQELKRQAITAYMKNKARKSGMEETVSRLVLDYIDFGNCFAACDWQEEYTIDEVTGEQIPGYIGPKVVRIDPYDIVFDPRASSFKDSPKIVRSVKSFGELAKDANKVTASSEEKELYTKAVQSALDTRTKVSSLTSKETTLSNSFEVDGFGSLSDYLTSGMVEILQFFGDFFDVENNKLYENHTITIIDRSFVLAIKKNPSWIVSSNLVHCGWRLRPDNLYAMGPLDNLVGLQYRIDHLENLKADVFDMIAFPIFKIKGNVEDFKYQPLERILVGEEGDVEMMRPDTTALNADMQIQEIEQRMEELAGAPKQAMGIRTPGEKTAFEVQTLENAAGRIFQNKVSYFEKMLLEPILNAMLEIAKRRMQFKDIIRVMGTELDEIAFMSVSKEDITSSGVLRPVGASHFARKANTFQNILNLMNSPAVQDPAVSAHISGFKLARTFESLLELEPFALVEKDIRLTEQADTQKKMDVLKGEVEQTNQINVDLSAKGMI